MFVSKRDEERVMGMIKLFHPKMREYIRFNIAVAMEEYLIQAINERLHRSDASEITRAKTTRRALLDAAKGLETLGRDAALHHIFPTLEELEPKEDRDAFMARLRALADSLDEFLKWTAPSKGRQSMTALRDFVERLYIIYWEATRKAPGVSSKPQKKDQSKGLSVHGPFVRFCETVVEMVNPHDKDSVYDFARAATRRLKKSGLDRGFIPTDKF